MIPINQFFQEVTVLFPLHPKGLPFPLSKLLIPCIPIRVYPLVNHRFLVHHQTGNLCGCNEGQFTIA